MQASTLGNKRYLLWKEYERHSYASVDKLQSCLMLYQVVHALPIVISIVQTVNRFEILTAVLLKIQVFWDVTLCCGVYSSPPFGGWYWLHCSWTAWLWRLRHYDTFETSGKISGLTSSTWPYSNVSLTCPVTYDRRSLTIQHYNMELNLVRSLDVPVMCWVFLYIYKYWYWPTPCRMSPTKYFFTCDRHRRCIMPCHNQTVDNFFFIQPYTTYI